MNCEISRIDVWSVVKITFFVGLFIGLLYGFVWIAFVLLISGFFSAIIPDEFAPEGISTGMALVVPFFLAPFMGILWATISAAGVIVYNLISKWAGGIRIDVEQELPQSPIDSIGDQNAVQIESIR